MNQILDRNGFGNDSHARLLLRSSTFSGYSEFPNCGLDAVYFTKVGSPVHVTSFSKFNGSSIYFNGSSYIYSSYKSQFNFDSSMEFTVDFWMSTTSLAGVRVIMEQFDGQVGPGWTLYQNGTSLVLYSTGAIGSITNFFTAINTFVHFAWVQKPGVGTKLFRNGISTGLIGGYVTASTTSPNFSVGARDDAGPKYYWTGHIDEARISNMARWWQNFTPPNRSYGWSPKYSGGEGCVCLITGEEAMTSPTTFTEWSRSSHVVNVNGNGLQKDSVNKVLGVYSWDGDGTSDFLNITSGLSDFSFGVSEDFTIDTWLWIDSVQPGTASYGIFTQNIYTATGLSVFAKSDLSLYMYYAGAARINGVAILPLDQWFHLAVIRYANVIRIYVNGLQYAGSWSFSGALSCTSELRILGRQFSPLRSLRGKVDNFRVTKGRAVWTAPFSTTLPSSRFEYYQ